MYDERQLAGGVLTASVTGLVGWIAASEGGLEKMVLGGLDDSCDTFDDLLFEPESSIANVSRAGVGVFIIEVSGGGLKIEIVLERFKAGFSSPAPSTGVEGFLGSGSLFSNFPLLSDAKYSSPRPKTTCKVA
jgi:hypothetical protein